MGADGFQQLVFIDWFGHEGVASHALGVVATEVEDTGAYRDEAGVDLPGGANAASNVFAIEIREA